MSLAAAFNLAVSLPEEMLMAIAEKPSNIMNSTTISSNRVKPRCREAAIMLVQAAGLLPAQQILVFAFAAFFAVRSVGE